MENSGFKFPISYSTTLQACDQCSFKCPYASWATGKMILLKQPSAWKSCRVEPPLNKLPVANFTNVLTIGFPVPSSKWKKKNTLLISATFLRSSWNCHSPGGGATPLKTGKGWFLGSKSLKWMHCRMHASLAQNKSVHAGFLLALVINWYFWDLTDSQNYSTMWLKALYQNVF